MLCCCLFQFDVTVKHDSWVRMHVAMVEAIRSLTYTFATVNNVLFTKKVFLVQFGKAGLVYTAIV